MSTEGPSSLDQTIARSAPTPAKPPVDSKPPLDHGTIAPSHRSSNSASAPKSAAPSVPDFTIPPTDKPAAKSVNRYVLKKYHARGGMGEVWVSEDPEIGREVAVKLLNVSGAGASERFISEAQITGQLEHPYIVPVHDLGHDELGRPFYVMKFVRGKSLKQTILNYFGSGEDKRTPSDLERAQLLNIFIDISQAVAYAHSRGVLHRDIKPDNIMLGEYGEVALLDWGLAKIRGQIESLIADTQVRTVSDTSFDTQAGSVLGSPLYMPPEMADGRIPETDERTDIYLLGATLYEILTGRTPREGRSRNELIDLARTTAPRPPSTLCKVDKPIEAICLKAMALQQKDRYPAVGVMVEDVKRYLIGEPVSAYREPWWKRAWRWSKRHQVAIRRTAAGIFIIAAGSFIIAKSRQAYQLQRREQAHQEIQTFDHLLDEARFYAANTDPVTEHAPYFDADKARNAEQAALTAAAGWGEDLGQLALPLEAPRLREKLYELLLLMAQDRLQIADEPSSKDAQSLLAKAGHLNAQPSRGYYRLNGLALQRLNDPHASEMATLSHDPKTPVNAFDLFLLGEELRRNAVASDEAVYNGLQAPTDRVHGIKDAVAKYSAALDLDPTFYWAQFQLARCYLSLGRTADAVQVFGTCIALRPDAPWSFSARAMAYGILGRFDEARADLEHALQPNPDFLPAVLNRGAIRWLQNDSSGAIGDFTRILQAPENRRLIEAAFYRAQVYIQQNDLDDALSDLNAVIAAQPDFAGAILLRGRVQLLKGHAPDCLTDLDRWLQSSRGIHVGTADRTSLLERAELLRAIAAGLPPTSAGAALMLARQDVANAMQLGEHSSRAYADQGAILDVLGDLKGALQAYTMSLLADPANTPCQINRAWAFQKAGRLENAGEDFKAVLRRDPDNAEAHTGLGYIEASEGQDASARDEASQAMLTGTSDYLILHNVACIYAALATKEPARATQSQDVAIAILQKAIQVGKLNAKGPDELRLMDQESAFDASLRARPEFQKLLASH